MATRQITSATICLLLASAVLAGPPTPKKEPKGQKIPTPQRVAEIHDALVSHGFAVGSSWPEVQAVCRKIQEDHLWQTDHAPDARVLGMLGLGSARFNPDVLTGPQDHLDAAQRAESSRRRAAGEPPI